jgi:hypothetical protein
MSLASLRLHSY